MARHEAEARGLYRVFSPAGYRIYRGAVPPVIGTDVPWATVTSLPATPALAWPDGTYYVAVTAWNGVVESGAYPIGPLGEPYRIITIAGGLMLTEPPQAPTVSLELRAGGVVRVIGLYLPTTDERADGAATEWALAYTTDGSDPAESTPDVTAAISYGTGIGELYYDLPAQIDGTEVRVRLQVRRDDGVAPAVAWSYSAGSAVLSALADAAGPAAPVGGEIWRGAVPEDL
jgi:hypothetical protein